MKNSLSHIYYALEDAAGKQPAGSTTWGGDVRVIETLEAGTKNRLWWVRADTANELLKDSQIDELTRAGCIAKGGAQKVRFGRASALAYCVLVEKLRGGVRAGESGISKAVMQQERIKQLESELKASREHNAADEAMGRLIEMMTKSLKLKPGGHRVVFERQKGRKYTVDAGVPTLLCSDWHWGETVDANQILDLNEYNVAIARSRADRVFRTTLELLFHQQSGMSYDGFVMAFAGDMLSGIILEELRQTNELSVMDSVLGLAQFLADGIVDFADNFPGLYAPCVVGNHGRLDRLPKAKNAYCDSFDYLLYSFVEMLVRGKMGSKCNVQFDIGRGLDLRYDVYHTRYLLTHGDSGKSGGTEHQDFWPNAVKNASRKQRRSDRGGIGRFDYVVSGHAHKYGAVSNVISNGSLKGYDEHAFKETMEFERPIQALWITNPDYGITSHVPIYADEREMDESSKANPITPASHLLARKK